MPLLSLHRRLLSPQQLSQFATRSLSSPLALVPSFSTPMATTRALSWRAIPSWASLSDQLAGDQTEPPSAPRFPISDEINAKFTLWCENMRKGGNGRVRAAVNAAFWSLLPFRFRCFSFLFYSFIFLACISLTPHGRLFRRHFATCRSVEFIYHLLIWLIIILLLLSIFVNYSLVSGPAICGRLRLMPSSIRPTRICPTCVLHASLFSFSPFNI